MYYPSDVDQQTKIVAIDTISNYIRNPDITQKHKISIQNTIKSSFNKLTNDMSVKVRRWF